MSAELNVCERELPDLGAFFAELATASAQEAQTRGTELPRLAIQEAITEPNLEEA